MTKLAKKSEVTTCHKLGVRTLNLKFLFAVFFSQKVFVLEKNDKRYPGSPDIVLPKYKTIVFVHGCFWHLHEGCKYAVMPKSNVDFWQKKLYRNRERDEINKNKLENMGWKVLIVWECQLKKQNIQQTLNTLYNQIITNL